MDAKEGKYGFLDAFGFEADGRALLVELEAVLEDEIEVRKEEIEVGIRPTLTLF